MSLFLVAKVYHIFLIRKKIARNFEEIFDFVDTQRVAKGNFSGFSVVKRFNSIILYIGDRRPWRSPWPVSCRIPDKTPAGYQKQSRTILNRFISAVRSPGGMIDHAGNGKRN